MKYYLNGYPRPCISRHSQPAIASSSTPAGISDGRRLAALVGRTKGKVNRVGKAATFVPGRWLDSLSNDNAPAPPPSSPERGSARDNACR